jgi:NADP-dependent 3-hydroxy acid dehydrogenase YdfG
MTQALVTLITGGSSGIGEAVARRLLGQGDRVAITGRHRDRLGRFAAESVAWALGQHSGVDVSTVIVRPVGQRV